MFGMLVRLGTIQVTLKGQGQLIGQSSKSQDELTTTAMDSAVRTLNVYAADGLWRTILNYSGHNALTKNRQHENIVPK